MGQIAVNSDKREFSWKGAFFCERPVCDQRSWGLLGKLVRTLAAVNRSLAILARNTPRATRKS
jgi:hypothetical protein